MPPGPVRGPGTISKCGQVIETARRQMSPEELLSSRMYGKTMFDAPVGIFAGGATEVHHRPTESFLLNS